MIRSKSISERKKDMTFFTVSLAGLNIGVRAIRPAIKTFCREFLTEGEPAFSVAIEEADLDYERSINEGQWTATCLETLALLRKVSDQLINHDTLLFHGSAVAAGGKAYIFTAPSGTGKTTHTRLWLDTVPGAHVLNGDKPFLRLENGWVLACGSPWRGKENLGINEILPLEAICILERDEVNHIEPIKGEKALGTLVRQTYRPMDPKLMLKALQLIGQAGQCVRLYRLGCNMDPEAAGISSRAMIGT